jgi:hypothetical protein
MIYLKEVLSKGDRLVPRRGDFADVVGADGGGEVDVGEATFLEENLRTLQK